MSVDIAIEILKECESRLRDQLTEAVEAGDYDAVSRLTDWARGVATLWSASNSERMVASSTKPAQRNGRHVKSSRRRVRRRSSSQSKRSRKTEISQYPKFVRVNDDLVKIGWSKKEKTEYQHKAPQEIVSLLIDRMVEIAPSQRLFNTEELFPLYNAEGVEVPSYQSYLCLAWLREINLIEPVGRQGYRFICRDGLRDSVHERWRRLSVQNQS